MNLGNGTTEYLLLSFGSLFVIVDPIATAPSFLVMTRTNTKEERIRMARMASLVAWIILTAFAMGGKWIFLVLGITMPAFQIAGGLVMMLIAFDMLQAKRSTLQETKEEKAAGVEKEDIAVTPLAVPMLAGPGAISTVMILANKASGPQQVIYLYVIIGLVSALSYYVLKITSYSHRFLNPIPLKIMARLMGLFLVAVAVQFILNGWSQFYPSART